ncbi:hypothetical protein SAMN06295967_11582 [Belliella buryatensis]|uniref:Uncharacterized protein n=1 Tax=Belliella buryatensis TaxID=1500549 RepID=A0A239GAT0_9BACT|nr:hypothetical protein [Belliella buryatensis]SNS66446.1 hypothetical protein SAMN06295967_11582 [Belliella buryatensis]
MDKEESKSLVKEPDWSYGKYSASLWMTVGDTARSSVIQGFELDLKEFFKDLKFFSISSFSNQLQQERLFS